MSTFPPPWVQFIIFSAQKCLFLTIKKCFLVFIVAVLFLFSDESLSLFMSPLPVFLGEFLYFPSIFCFLSSPRVKLHQFPTYFRLFSTWNDHLFMFIYFSFFSRNTSDFKSFCTCIQLLLTLFSFSFSHFVIKKK